VQEDLDHLNGLIDTLPFRLHDAEAVNDYFCRHVRRPRRRTEETIAVWTYCYIRRYYTVKFLKESGFRSSELEQIVEKAYRKVDENKAKIERPDHYAQWVSVVCRNTYINFVKRRTYVLELDDEVAQATGSPEYDAVEDPAVLYMTIVRAIDRLPVFLRSCARMRFIEDLSYDEISRMTGISIPTVRAYVHKICLRFREDRALKSAAERYP